MHRAAHSEKTPVDSRRIVVVGPCASGKSTLTHHLRDLGFDARVCGQEHSAIRHLWKRLQPELLIALDVDLRTLRRRRHPSWPERLYRVQRERLEFAFRSADLSIDSSAVSATSAVDQVLAWIAEHPIRQERTGPPARVLDHGSHG